MQPIGSERVYNTSDTRYVLAIDLGSGGHKVAIIADSGQVIASADEKITTYLLPGGGAEQDPEEWWMIRSTPPCGEPPCWPWLFWDIARSKNCRILSASRRSLSR